MSVLKHMSLFFLLCSFSVSVLGQEIQIKKLDELVEPEDSVNLFTLEEYLQVVMANHPVVKQANLLPETAQQEIQLARGAFDPKLTGNWSAKNYKDTDYYDLFNTTLKVPLWFPVDPKISFDRNKGEYVNPQNYIAESENYRQITMGLSLPVGRGLFIDDRRAAVRQAESFVKINDAEKVKMINKVVLDALKAYWDWYFGYFEYKVVDQSLNISSEIYRRVKLDYEFGEVAVVDTVQAAITLQNRKTDLQAALIDFRKASLRLANYLWTENGIPLEVRDNVVPVLDVAFELPQESLDSLISYATENHPELLKLSAKGEQLEVSEKLAKENLKPRVDLNYNLINAPIDYDGDFVPLDVRNNYKFGVDVEFPLFLRKERAKLKQTKIKVEQNNFEQAYTKQQILNDVRGVYFELENGNQMLSLLRAAVGNYERLLEAEIFNLETGESDLFKINFQQDKLLESQIKLIKQYVLVEKAKAQLFYAAGNLNQLY